MNLSQSNHKVLQQLGEGEGHSIPCCYTCLGHTHLCPATPTPLATPTCTPATPLLHPPPNTPTKSHRRWLHPPPQPVHICCTLLRSAPASPCQRRASPAAGLLLQAWWMEANRQM
ncbi:T-box transcription factor TBX6 [Platysternon megacephalum]|uniref:T-box transcription factor TBX6 n=1 Tax=Platysternon megacephalum TaxID=55544 RepID=A0A4D9DSJ5_9SAUR|nr:T-box transcription factor TBX6 [Platysternon megacephalum]